MVSTLTIVYSALAAIATVIVFVVSDRFGEERQPAPRRLALSAAAGLVWPLVLIGVAELSSFAMYAKAHEHDDEDERVDVLV